MSNARRWYECAICQTEILKGQFYYRDEPHPKARYHRGAVVRQICVHCVDSDAFAEEQGYLDRLSERADEFAPPVRVELVDVTAVLLERLRLDWDEIYRISEEQLEELACERLAAMDFEVQRVGRTNRKDGGIDIAFWDRGPFPRLGAAQVKHHRQANRSTGVGVVRDFQGALTGNPFQFGIILTNTTFTPDAKWFAENRQGFLRLRDGEELRRWIDDKFLVEELWRAVPRKLVLCPDVEIEIPSIFR